MLRSTLKKSDPARNGSSLRELAPHERRLRLLEGTQRYGAGLFEKGR
jgi:hypothetical protein